ncbi:MAG: transcriptional regulator, IclR family [Rhizobacter sp.]|nr:transcriptional regulator, IclR family [Rhizobacter sp.]
MSEDTGRYSVSGGTQSIERAALLLRLIADNNRTGLRLVDLYQTAGLQRPTAHRILQSLTSERLVKQDSKTRRYFLGPQLYEMGLAAAPKAPLHDICHRHLQVLADRSGDTVFLTERSRFDGVCTDRVEGAYPIKVFALDIGRRRPLNVGAGSLAILSALSDVEVDRIFSANLERTSERYSDYSEQLQRECVEAGRQKGYVLHDILGVPGVRAIGVPIRNAEGQPVAGISISTLVSRLEGERVRQLASYLFEAQRAIEPEVIAFSMEANRLRGRAFVDD